MSLSKINVCAKTLFKPVSPSEAINFSAAFFTSSKVVDKFLALAASVPPNAFPNACLNKSNTYWVPLMVFKYSSTWSLLKPNCSLNNLNTGIPSVSNLLNWSNPIPPSVALVNNKIKAFNVSSGCLVAEAVFVNVFSNSSEGFIPDL